MPLLLCRAVVTMGSLKQKASQTEMQFEHDMFEAIGVELASQARRQRVSRLTASFTSAWRRIVDRPTRPSREAQAHSKLLERMENMPAYMLKDIGVSRDSAGRFCHYNDYGMLVQVAPAEPTTPPTPSNTSFGGRQTAYAAQ